MRVNGRTPKIEPQMMVKDSYLRDQRQNESNIVIEAPWRSSCSHEIDDALDGGVGAVTGGFEPAVY